MPINIVYNRDNKKLVKFSDLPIGSVYSDGASLWMKTDHLVDSQGIYHEPNVNIVNLSDGTYGISSYDEMVLPLKATLTVEE